MARPRSARVAEIKAKLVARIRDGFHRPGDPFISNRALAERDRISYQTAHRLLEELVGEGWLERRISSGTFIAGRAERIEGVQLIFSRRAQSPGSFGASLLQRLVRSLRDAHIPFVQSLVDTEVRFRARHLPVIWECPGLLERRANERRFCVLLQDSPPPGLGASYIDCVRTDDFSGGVCAAQVLLERPCSPSGLVIVAGPDNDQRSARRVKGFLALVPGARIIHSGGWFVEHGRRAAPQVFEDTVTGVFCCNDRLAQGLLAEFETRGIRPAPSVVGFDNAPIAEALHLTTIAIPWEQFAQETLALVQNRLSGDSSPARQIILSLRPHKRLTA
ncbi:MAG: substrate-binding domain-containing protein [Opitutaceae bacterium]|nr:substrate-binding domain-containing protein [Opitutaceae bacterium]